MGAPPDPDPPAPPPPPPPPPTPPPAPPPPPVPPPSPPPEDWRWRDMKFTDTLVVIFKLINVARKYIWGHTDKRYRKDVYVCVGGGAVWPSVCPPSRLLAHTYIHLCIHPSICLSLRSFIFPYVNLTVHPSECLSICLFIFLWSSATANLPSLGQSKNSTKAIPYVKFWLATALCTTPNSQLQIGQHSLGPWEWVKREDQCFKYWTNKARVSETHSTV